jgi:bifunctional DNA-binding transcriptional regulator/antitoxin component of YhaV-PrlF toxin-antitoxin module
MERIDEVDVITIHSDQRTVISKHIRDRHQLKPGDKLTIHISGITRKQTADVEELVAGKVDGHLKPEKPQEPPEETPQETPGKPGEATVELSADQEKMMGVIKGP